MMVVVTVMQSLVGEGSRAGHTACQGLEALTRLEPSFVIVGAALRIRGLFYCK